MDTLTGANPQNGGPVTFVPLRAQPAQYAFVGRPWNGLFGEPGFPQAIKVSSAEMQ
jgi:hypothetical protein